VWVILISPWRALRWILQRCLKCWLAGYNKDAEFDRGRHWRSGAIGSLAADDTERTLFAFAPRLIGS